MGSFGELSGELLVESGWSRKVCIAAVKHNPKLLAHMPKYRGDAKFLKRAMSFAKPPKSDRYKGVEMFEFVSDALKRDEDFMFWVLTDYAQENDIREGWQCSPLYQLAGSIPPELLNGAFFLLVMREYSDCDARDILLGTLEAVDPDKDLFNNPDFMFGLLTLPDGHNHARHMVSLRCDRAFMQKALEAVSDGEDVKHFEFAPRVAVLEYASFPLQRDEDLQALLGKHRAAAVKEWEKPWARARKRWRLAGVTLLAIQRMQKDREAAAAKKREADLTEAMLLEPDHPLIKGSLDGPGLLRLAWDMGYAAAGVVKRARKE
jgi:hypothetical protein